MSGVWAAMASGSDEEREAALNREVLRAAVMRQITCPRSGAVLDVRTAVYYRVTAPGGSTGADCVTGEAFDVMEEQLRDTCTRKNIELEVIDGRKL